MSKDTRDITEKLRRTASDIRKTSPMGEWHAKANIEAADEITRLRAEKAQKDLVLDSLKPELQRLDRENTELRAERDEAKRLLHVAIDDGLKLVDIGIKRAEERNAAVEALEKIAGICDPKVHPENQGHDGILWVGDIAREVLARIRGDSEEWRDSNTHILREDHEEG